MGNIVIQVENLSKEYRLGTINHGTLKHDLQSWWARIRGKEDPNSIISFSRQITTNSKERQDAQNPHFLALKDVSFEVKRGETLGIIGRNGAGKSTLLKILSQVTSPTQGMVKIKGRVSSLLEVGTGFHPELTGRENIFLNGAILGMTKKEISGKFDEIVDFAEVEKFVDTPVKRYSSGMYVRLAFAVAAHLDPEILIVDEVLAVGDAQFQKKCQGKMKEVGREGRTILFVSHNMVAVTNLCQKGILIDSGTIVKAGPIDAVVAAHITAKSADVTEKKWDTCENAPGSEEFRIKRIYVCSSDETSDVIENNKEIFIGIDFWLLKECQNFAITLQFLTSEGTIAFSTSTSHHPQIRNKQLEKGLFTGVCRIPANFLNSIVYTVALKAVLCQKVVFDMENAITFEVADSGNYRGAYFGKRGGAVAPLLLWDLLQRN